MPISKYALGVLKKNAPMVTSKWQSYDITRGLHTLCALHVHTKMISRPQSYTTLLLMISTRPVVYVCEQNAHGLEWAWLMGMAKKANKRCYLWSCQMIWSLLKWGFTDFDRFVMHMSCLEDRIQQFCVDDWQTKPITLPIAHACGGKYQGISRTKGPY